MGDQPNIAGMRPQQRHRWPGLLATETAAKRSNTSPTASLLARPARLLAPSPRPAAEQMHPSAAVPQARCQI